MGADSFSSLFRRTLVCFLDALPLCSYDSLFLLSHLCSAIYSSRVSLTLFTHFLSASSHDLGSLIFFTASPLAFSSHSHFTTLDSRLSSCRLSFTPLSHSHSASLSWTTFSLSRHHFSSHFLPISVLSSPISSVSLFLSLSSLSLPHFI